MGHLKDLSEVLHKIVNNTWDIKEALVKRNLDRHLEEMDDSLKYELMPYWGNPDKPDDLGKPDLALLAINEIIRQEPKLKYAPFIAFNTFYSLLKIDSHKAYEYGKEAIVTSTYTDPPCDLIIGAIETCSNKLSLPVEIYESGAEAYHVKINQIPYPEIVDISKLYNKMAEWYFRANDKSKAIGAQEKAIDAMKSKKGFSKTDMAAFEFRLQQYKKM